jgi:hypothetical protein
MFEKRTLKGGKGAPDLDQLPVRVPRDVAAQLVTEYYFEVSPRTMERWPLTWRRLNNKAHCDVTELFGLAEAMLADAPAIMGGQSKVAA